MVIYVKFLCVSNLVLFLAAVTDSSDLKCYVHAVSPVKVSASGKCKYFNMTLQTSEGSRSAVCFSPEKCTTLEKHQADKSPVKISNFKFSSNYSKDNVVIDRSSKITPVGDDVGFLHVEMAPPSVTSLLSLNQVSSEQLVTLKAKVAKISGCKKITTSKNPNSQLVKQELVIVDPTASVKVILWEQFVDCLKEGQTYLLKNLRLKRDNGSMYLNTPKSNEFSFEEVQEFAETVVADVQLVSSVEICGSIIGVESISTYQACLKCGKKAVPVHGKVLKCEKCHMLQKIAPSSKRWFLRCLFANLNNETEKISLAIFNENVKAMVDLHGNDVFGFFNSV